MSTKKENKFAELIAQCSDERPAELQALEGLESFWAFIQNTSSINQGTLILDIALRIKAKNPDWTARQIASQFYAGGRFQGMGFGGQYAKKLENWYPIGKKAEGVPSASLEDLF